MMTTKWEITLLIFTSLVFLVAVAVADNNAIHDNKQKIVSYEYTRECDCGGTVEGYHSLVDGFTQEECKSCGFHKEGIE